MHDSCMSGKGSRAWWSTVNTITGRDTQPQSISSVIHPDTINEYFCNINSDPEYIAPSIIYIPDDARIPEIPLHVVTQLLSKLKRTACGPDELPYWLFKEFAHDLALLLPMCLIARCDNIKYHLLGKWQTSGLYKRNLH